MTALGKRQAALSELRAEQLMTHNPRSISQDATLQRAAQFLLDNHFTAAPVIDDGGRPQGVISLTDIARYNSKPAFSKLPSDDYYDRTVLTLHDMKKWEGFDFSCEAKVRDAMTPVVLAIAPETPIVEAVEMMLDRQVHRLFVKDATGILVGIISTFDVLRHLIASANPEASSGLPRQCV